MQAKPIVDGLERELAGKVRVARVDLHTGVGQQLASRYNFNYTPFFVLLDGRGQIVWQGNGAPPSAQTVESAVAKP